MAALLEIKDMSLNYGAVEALRGISLHIERGEIVSMLGANGAGKTSTLRAVSGLEKISAGSIAFDGVSLAGKKPHTIVQQGIAHAPEGRRIFAQMSVLENLLIGAHLRDDAEANEATLQKVFDYFPVLKERLRQMGGTLSGGEQQMLAVGRALMLNPHLLILDEPSLGLAPRYIDQIFDIIRCINQQEGVTIFLIEQNANEALQHSDRAYVLENGIITIAGTAEQLISDPRVQSAYLGI